MQNSSWWRWRGFPIRASRVLRRCEPANHDTVIAMSDFTIEPKPSRTLWIVAAVVAVALHAGGAALALTHLQNDEFDEDLGAPAVEIGLEMMAPKAEPSELPPGPDSEASVASPALAEQKAEVKEAALPKDHPT